MAAVIPICSFYRKDQRLFSLDPVKRLHTSTCRLMALQLLRQHGSDLSNKAIAKRTGVDLRTVGSLRCALISGDDACFKKGPNPAGNRAGRRFTLKEYERKVVLERSVNAARRGFAMIADTLRDVMRRIAADCHQAQYGNSATVSQCASSLHHIWKSGEQGLFYTKSWESWIRHDMRQSPSKRSAECSQRILWLKFCMEHEWDVHRW